MKNLFATFSQKVLLAIMVLAMLSTAGATSSCSIVQQIKDEINTHNGSADQKSGSADDKKLTALDFAMFSDSVTSDTISLHFAVADPKALDIQAPAISLGDVSKEYSDNQLEKMQGYLDQLQAINYDKLSGKSQITYDVLKYDLQEALQFKDYFYYSSSFNSITGIQSDLPLVLSEYTFDSKKDVDDYLLLLQDVHRYYEDLMKFEAERAAQGLGSSDENIQKVIDACTAFLADKDNHFLVSSFAERLDSVKGLSDADKQTYIDKNQAALDDYVFPAYQLLIDGFTDLLGTGVHDGGLCNLKNGKEYYTLLLKAETSSDTTVDGAIQQINDQISKDIDVFTATTYDDAFTKAYASYNFSKGSVQENLDYCKEAIQTDFPPIMKHTVTLKQVPSQLEDFFSPAAYLSCRIDDPTDNLILTNTAALDGYQNLLGTIAHEGYPGHLYESVYHAQNIASYYQRYASFTGYSEGWAEYAGAYVVDHAGYDANLVAYVNAENEVFNLLFPSRIDIGVNYEGWDRQAVYDYLAQYNIDMQDYADSCYDTSVEIPCYYMPYSIGHLNTAAIISGAQDKLGDSVSLKDIHKAYLDIGPAPFPIIEKYMQVYIDKSEE